MSVRREPTVLRHQYPAVHTNILLYTLAADDRRQPLALDWLSRGGVISVQVLNEFAAVSRRKLGLSWQEITEAFAAFRRLCDVPVSLTVTLHEAALGLAERHQFSFYDALIVAAALDAGCDLLLTEDLHHGLVVQRSLTVTDPFRTT